MIAYKTLSEHDRATQKVQNQLKGLCSPIALAPNDASNTLREGAYKNNTDHVDLSAFTAVIHIDKQAMTIEIEPRASMRQLVAACLAEGLIPLVVPEFTSITVGGAIMGAALESSSHREGQFSDTALEYEVLLGDGSKLKVSPESHPDLFYGLSGSYGSLCLLTLVKLQLKPAKPFVHLTIEPFEDQGKLLATLKERSEADFVEGIVFEPNFGVVITGKLSDTPPHCGQNISQSKWMDRFFYHQILQLAQEGHKQATMTLSDYLFRLDRGAFWMGRFLLSPLLLLQAIFKFRVTTMPEKIKKNTSRFPVKKRTECLLSLSFWLDLQKCDDLPPLAQSPSAHQRTTFFCSRSLCTRRKN